MTGTTHLTLTVASLLLIAVSLNPPARAADSLQSECQSEASLYEIPAEQQADYVAGCIASRGGFTAMEPVEEATPEGYADSTELPAGEPAAEDYPQ